MELIGVRSVEQTRRIKPIALERQHDRRTIVASNLLLNQGKLI